MSQTVPPWPKAQIQKVPWFGEALRFKGAVSSDHLGCLQGLSHPQHLGVQSLSIQGVCVCLCVCRCMQWLSLDLCLSLQTSTLLAPGCLFLWLQNIPRGRAVSEHPGRGLRQIPGRSSEKVNPWHPQRLWRVHTWNKIIPGTTEVMSTLGSVPRP